MQEPMYGDLDADGIPIDDSENESWRDPDMLGEATAKIVRLFMQICSYSGSRRKNFVDRKEERAWRRIERKLKDKTIPIEWIRFVYGYTKEMNKNKITRNFANATAYILNREKMIEWIAKNDLTADETADYEDDPGGVKHYD